MMNDLNKKLAFVCALSMSAFLVSCGGAKESDKVGEAQACLDTATKGQAAACTEKLAGIDTANANVIRCAAGFIDEGFTESSRFNTAFNGLSNGSGNSTEAFMGVLAFNSKATADLNVTFASETYDYCAKSKAKGLMLLGSMAKTATTLAKLAGTFASGSTMSETDIHNALTTAASDPAAKEAIGSAIITTYTASCQTGNQSNKELCTDFDAALVGVDTTSSAAVGAAIVNYWNTH